MDVCSQGGQQGQAVQDQGHWQRAVQRVASVAAGGCSDSRKRTRAIGKRGITPVTTHLLQYDCAPAPIHARVQQGQQLCGLC